MSEIGSVASDGRRLSWAGDESPASGTPMALRERRGKGGLGIMVDDKRGKGNVLLVASPITSAREDKSGSPGMDKSRGSPMRRTRGGSKTSLSSSKSLSATFDSYKTNLSTASTRVSWNGTSRFWKPIFSESTKGGVGRVRATSFGPGVRFKPTPERPDSYYEVPSGFGPQADSTRSTEIRAFMSMSTREATTKAMGLTVEDKKIATDPGAYNMPSAFLKQPLSTKRSARGYNMAGASGRDPLKEAKRAGARSPGSKYAVRGGINDSAKIFHKPSASFGFGSRNGIARKGFDSSPGPIYKLPSFIGKGPGYTHGKRHPPRFKPRFS